MKLNFWQWLAVGLLIIGCAVWAYQGSHRKPAPLPAPDNMPTTQNIKAS